MTQERVEHLLQVEELRLPVLERDHVDAEHRFHRCVLEEVVEDDIRNLAALQLDDDAHSILVRLVAKAVRCNAVDDLDRKSTRLNSSHVKISYAVFCLKKKTPICTEIYS